VDILVRGSDPITGKRMLSRLKRGQSAWFWRGLKPRRISEGDRLYFVDKGTVYGHARYVDYRNHSGRNQQGAIQSGGAFKITGPLVFPRKPVRLGSSILGAPWRWRYVPSILSARLRMAR
jgi:hypothetical protein